jgi:hypothetical membrane protein
VVASSRPGTDRTFAPVVTPRLAVRCGEEACEMKELVSTDSSGGVMAGGWRSRTATKALLVAGIVAVGVYAVGDLLSGLLYEGYSYRDQAISELTAFGSPVRPLMVAAILVHGLLLVAFGVGVWRSADRRSLRWVGLLLVAAGLVGFPTHTVFAMSSRWMEGGFNDTMHIILSGVFSLFVFVAVALSAVAYRGWFRLYSIVTLVVLIGFGGAASIAIRGIEENLTPWAGVSSASTPTPTSRGWLCWP